MGSKVDWNGDDKTVTITDEGNNVIIAIDSTEAQINGESVTLDVSPKIINSRTYVPLRFVAEALNADVQYISKFLGYGNITAVIIEKPAAGARAFTPEEGLEYVKKASVEQYNNTIPYDEGGWYADTDPEDVSYTGENFGRYYIYRHNKWDESGCYFNIYTGDICCNRSQHDNGDYLWITNAKTFGLNWFPLAG